MKDNHNTNAVDFYTAMSRLTRCVWALENAKPEIIKVLLAGHAHPAFHNIQAELGNLDHVLRSLPIERDDEGRPLHPNATKQAFSGSLVMDTSEAQHARLLKAWRELFADEPMTLQEAVNTLSSDCSVNAQELKVLFEAIAGERGEINLQHLGTWFREHVGPGSGDWRLVAGPKTRVGVAWQVLRA